MRRAALPVAVVLAMSGAARADPWMLTMEGGGEADSNVTRVETISDGTAQPIAAPVALAGAKIANKDRLFDGNYVLGASGLARMVASSGAKDENVMLAAADARWLRPLSGQPVAIGVAVTAADAFALLPGVGPGARTFRNLGADGVLTLGGGEDRHLTLALGARDFVYKPDHTFDWSGPTATARLDVMLWQAAARTRSLELISTLGFEARDYASTADVATCPDSRGPCPGPTTLTRRDRYERAGVEVDYAGEVVVTAGYQLTVIDSNSYGQSLIRHRVIVSATAELLEKLFGTITAALQLDQYPDGIVVDDAILRQELTSLEDENRSSLQVRIARALSTSWSLEARGAIWHDFGDTSAGTFRRELVYTGAVYTR